MYDDVTFKLLNLALTKAKVLVWLWCELNVMSGISSTLAIAEKKKSHGQKESHYCDEFFLMGLSQSSELRLSLWVFCLIIYLIILLGNSFLIVISILDSRLHTPMYFFLGNLSFLDICYTSSSIPSMLISFRSQRKSISFLGCALQMVFSLSLGSTECVLLAMMAYDRYVAICNPLRYMIIMNKILCAHMAAWSWIIGCANSLVQTVLTMVLPFCGNNVTSCSLYV
ncbi:PREDICTED: olfactory receptor 13D1-like [Chrysochloris asiatica]|uniref:Olfactory receptor 13D1-like n=1 Tax=Chrysochloris asiatica TaxID=185453 RepID=A0A9B0TG62_CHRAS|nr:PREDICTED: olfactory receptor 13D1-like [Chrysochloris asiatica]